MKIKNLLKSTYILPIIGFIFAIGMISYKSYNYYNKHKKIEVNNKKVKQAIEANPFD